MGASRYSVPMGLFNTRNLRKAKQLLEKNRHKVGDVVEKAGTQLDKVSKGKTSSVTSKASDAAKKYSTGGATHHGIDTPPMPPPGQYDPSDGADAKRQQAAAAGAVTGAANAFTNFLNKAADKVEQAKPNGASDAAASSTDDAATSDGIVRDEFDKG